MKAAIITNPILQFDRYPTRGNAIKAMCAHCVGCNRSHVEVGFRQDIRDCKSTECPLHMYRPFQKKGDTKDAVAHTP